MEDLNFEIENGEEVSLDLDDSELLVELKNIFRKNMNLYQVRFQNLTKI